MNLYRKWQGLIFVTALIPRLLGLGIEPLWYDEAFSARMAQIPNLAGVFHAALFDVHGPLWYVIEWLTVRLLGNSEWALRVPALAFGVLIPLLIYAICIEIRIPNQVAVLAAVLVCFLPSAIYYSQEARVYTLLAIAVLGLLLGCLRNNWLIIPSGILTLYAHNLGAFYVMVLALAHIAYRWQWYRGWRARLRAVGPFVCIGGAFIPGLWVLLQQIPNTAQFWITPVTPGSLPELFYTMWFGGRLPVGFQIVMIPTVFFLLIISMVSTWGKVFYRGWYLQAVIFGAPLTVWIISALWRPVFLPRAMLISALLCVIPVAFFMVQSFGRPARLLRYTVAVSLALGLVFYYRPSEPRSAARDATQLAVQPGEAVYFSSIAVAILYSYYLPGVNIYIDPNAGDLNQQLKPDAVRLMGFQRATLDQLRAQYSRVYWLYYSTPGTSAWELAYYDRSPGQVIRAVHTDNHDFEIKVIDNG